MRWIRGIERNVHDLSTFSTDFSSTAVVLSFLLSVMKDLTLMEKLDDNALSVFTRLFDARCVDCTSHDQSNIPIDWYCPWAPMTLAEHDSPCPVECIHETE